ncbi:type VII secretion-associated protein [Pseudonocardia sp.]|uniref:type VII secretion-associated protein n=1 Tax=Pseudonocardia sp. TaxID=60912 RepID=UPI002639EA95|nr:type VII secretion-associated protein [Pseudonocardia sp.]
MIPLTFQVGATAVRVAGTGPDGSPRVLELAPGAPAPPGARRVGPGGIPAAVAAAGHRGGEVVVVDVGHRRAEVALVRDGAVVARRAGPGGAALDAVVARLLRARCPEWADRAGRVARRARESLSLLPETVVEVPGSPHRVRLGSVEVRHALREHWGELVGAVSELAAPARPVLLIGGGARDPQLAELLDAAGLPDVTVAPRPDAAALLGAQAPLPPPVAPRTRWLPAVPHRTGRWRAGLGAAVAAVALLGLHVLGGTLAPAPAPVGDDVLAQYGYRLQIPPGWAHTGGLPERRRSLLTPLGAPEGSDLVVVEATPLGYDSAAEPERAAAELRAVFDEAVAAGAPLAGYVPATGFGGRTVTAYTERRTATDVRWYVLLDGFTQLSVGCRHTPAGAGGVLDACEQVVATLDG